MSVRKIVSSLLLLFLSLSVYGQSARQQAQRLFASGQYGDAASLCYGAAATAQQSDKDYFYSLAKKCENCENLRKQGSKQFSSGDYAGAAASYRKLLALNASDSVAKSRIDECERTVAAAEAEANALAAAKAAEDEIWRKAVSAGTEEAYNEYLANSTLKSHVSEAKDRIAQIEEKRNAAQAINTQRRAALDAYNRGDYNTARRNLLWLSQNDVLSSYEDAMLDKCNEEIMYKSFVESPNLTSGKSFLSRWPNSTHKSDVRNAMARQLANVGDFSQAESYASDRETKKYVAEQKKASERRRPSQNSSYASSSTSTSDYKHSTISSESRTYVSAARPSSTRRRSAPSIGLGLNFGMDMDFASDVYTLAIPRVEFAVGGYENIFNFAIGAQYRRYSGNNQSKDSFDIGTDLDFAGEWHPHLVTNQICFPATARFNIATRTRDFGYFVAVGASFNLALSSYYQREILDDKSQKINIDGLTLANKSNVSAFAKTGVCWKYLDFGLFVRYDITPVYDRAAVASDVILNDSYNFNFYNNYEAIRNQVDKRLFFGFTMTMTVVLKD